jgi:hypothetical protein
MSGDLHRAPPRVALVTTSTNSGVGNGGSSAAASTSSHSSTSMSTSTSIGGGAATDDSFQIHILRSELRYETHGSHAPLSVFALVCLILSVKFSFFFFFFFFFFFSTFHRDNASKLNLCAGNPIQERALDHSAPIFTICTARFRAARPVHENQVAETAAQIVCIAAQNCTKSTIYFLFLFDFLFVLFVNAVIWFCCFVVVRRRPWLHVD